MPEKAYIIIVTWNGQKFIRDCLSSIYRQKGSDFGVIVIDNNSTDDTKIIIENEFNKVYLIKNSNNVGFAAANNQGMLKAVSLGADYVILLNQDTEVSENFVQAGVRHMQEHQELGLMSPIIFYPKDSLIWFAGSKVYRGKEILAHPTTKIGHHINKKKPLSEKDKYNSVDWIPACALFIRKPVLEKIGLLDEKFFMYGEDVDFSFRAKKAGFKLGITTATSIIHKEEINKKLKFNIGLLKKISFKVKARYVVISRYYSFVEKCYYIIKLIYTPLVQIFNVARKNFS